jgi:RNA polymerase-associated protein RTF1
VNPYRLEGIYENEEDRERLLDMPELEREAELAARRDLITQRRQKADLRAMVRNQQMAGRRGGQQKPAKKARKLKKASAPRQRKSRRRADSDDEVDEQDEEDDDDDEEDEEDEESDYESTRRGARSRKPVGKSSSKTAQLQKLRKSRAKAQRRRQGGGGGSDDESSGAETESSYDAEEAEALWRHKKERERSARGDTTKREVKQTREAERLKKKVKWSPPTLADVNLARVRRDHFTRLVHRPDWMNQLLGKFARINFTQKDGATGQIRTTYRLVQIVDCDEGDRYYEVSDQCTNVLCDMSWGGEKMRKVSLQFVSNSPVTQPEYDDWLSRVESMDRAKAQRSVPSHEATLDQADDLEAFINRPFTEHDINQVLSRKKQAREAFQAAGGGRSQKGAAASNGGKPRVSGQNGLANVDGSLTTTQAGVNAQVMAQMNERHRKAERERINEAERRNALAVRLAAQKLSSKQGTPAVDTPSGIGTPLAASVPASPAVKAASAVGEPTSIAIAAADVEVDLGDF